MTKKVPRVCIGSLQQMGRPLVRSFALAAVHACAPTPSHNITEAPMEDAWKLADLPSECITKNVNVATMSNALHMTLSGGAVPQRRVIG